MDRRQFFIKSAQKATELVVKRAESRVRKKAERWIRPPYALPELDFLLSCTRCGQCIEACPHTVIFPLAMHLGPEVMNTPALDLLNRGCHLCADWPCVKACEPKALRIPVADSQTDETDTDETDTAVTVQTAPPKLAHAWIDAQTCLPYSGPECGACRYICPIPGAMQWQLERPRVDSTLCTGCALCRQACITEPKSIRIESIKTASDSN